jgi:uncharacterized membrane protein YhaH (DUF805 family)
MLRRIGVYGVIAGLLVGVPMVLGMVFLPRDATGSNGQLIGYTTMLIALSVIFLAIKRFRDIDRGGVIHFLPAFLMGLGVSAVAGVVYVLAWELSLAITQMDFAGEYTRATLAREAAKGASAEALAKMKADMEAFAKSYANPLFRLPMTFIEIFPVGVLVSAVSAGLLRNSRFLPARRS